MTVASLTPFALGSSYLYLVACMVFYEELLLNKFKITIILKTMRRREQVIMIRKFRHFLARRVDSSLRFLSHRLDSDNLYYDSERKSCWKPLMITDREKPLSLSFTPKSS